MTFLNAVQLFLLGVLTLVMGVPAILLSFLLPGKNRKGKLFRLVSRTYARISMWFFRIEVAGRGMENIDALRPYVFMSNHVSHADSPALALVISHPLHWVFKKELAQIPVFGWVLLACGQIMVDRSDPEKSRAYPEGTRSRDGNLQRFKKGGFWMALQVGLPIVPVRVSGSREVVPADTLRIRPGTVTVEIFPPIETRGKTAADIPDLMARVREAMLSGRKGGEKDI
jgi:1-acyl-sn-glycerol-3-phosphate acyltransferase